MIDALVRLFATLDLEPLTASLTSHERSLLTRTISADARGYVHYITPRLHFFSCKDVRLKMLGCKSQTIHLLLILRTFRQLSFCPDRGVRNGVRE